MRLPIDYGVGLLDYAFESEWEHNVFLRWIAGHEFGMSFSEFKEAVKPVPIKTTAQILDDVDDIMEHTSWQKSS